MRSILRGLAAWLVAAAGCTALAAAAQDLPTRVGRVAYIEGSVSIYQDPEFGWDQAYVNSPVTTQNSLWTDPGARAEMRAGGLALRMAERTQLDVSHLDDDGIDAMVQRGAVAIRVRHFERAENDVFSTPDAQFRLLADGRYRLDADADRGESRLVVFAGRAVLQGGDGDVPVAAGSAIVVAGGTYHLERASADDLDRWADARDRTWVERSVTQYVAPDITGYEELDSYGSWINEPGYGALWMPTHVSSGWVPYREGHWAWVAPWGWTWIDNEPWGYAPFHYGRWVHVRDRWCWYPGRRIDRQAWAPALVGWIGGSNFSVSVRGSSAPALGWYPLAPQETFHPWYRANSQYVNRVNVIVHTVDDRRRDRNAPPAREVNRDRGATVVPRDTFLHQRPVSQNVVNVAPQLVRQQPAATQPATLLPSRNDAARDRPASRGPGSRDRAGQDQHRAGAAPTGQLAGTSAQGARPPEHPSFTRPAARPAPHAAPNAPSAQKPAANAPATNPFARTPERGNRADREAPHAAPAPQPQPQAAPAAPATNPFARTPERGNRTDRETPHAAPQPQPHAVPQPQPQAAPAAPATNPFARVPEQDNRARDAQQRAAEQQRQQQQAQQRAAEQQRQQQQAQQRAAEQQRQQQQAQQRAAEQQRQQQQQLQQQQQQQQQQERAAREAQQRQQQQQQAQQRAAEQQQRAQQQQQERAAREAQQRAAEQQRQQQQQQQAQQRAAEQQQRAQQQQQERAAREAQRPAPPQHPSPPEKNEKNEKKDDHGSGG